MYRVSKSPETLSPVKVTAGAGNVCLAIPLPHKTWLLFPKLSHGSNVCWDSSHYIFTKATGGKKKKMLAFLRGFLEYSGSIYTYSLYIATKKAKKLVLFCF